MWHILHRVFKAVSKDIDTALNVVPQSSDDDISVQVAMEITIAYIQHKDSRAKTILSLYVHRTAYCTLLVMRTS